jgi:hypothetical protein
MEKTKRNTTLTKRPFKPGYDMLPGKFQTPVRIEIMERCGWTTYATFLNKKSGKVPIRPPEFEIVAEIFAEYNLDPWTGDDLSEIPEETPDYETS